MQEDDTDVKVIYWEADIYMESKANIERQTKKEKSQKRKKRIFLTLP